MKFADQCRQVFGTGSNKGESCLLNLLKLLAITIIVLAHNGGDLGWAQKWLVPHFYMGCEFCFMVTGFYLARHALERTNHNVLRYTWGKVRRIWPTHALCWITLLAALVASQTELSVEVLRHTLSENTGLIMELLLVHRWGFSKQDLGAPDWYVSAMLLSVALIYALLSLAAERDKNQKDGLTLRFFMFCSVLVMFSCWGYLLDLAGTLAHNGMTPVWGFVNTSLMRSTAAMLCGVLLYMTVRHGRVCGEIAGSKGTALEVLAVACFVAAMLMQRLGAISELGGILLFAVSIAACDRCRGILGTWAGFGAVRVLCACSMTLFLSHILWAHYHELLLPSVPWNTLNVLAVSLGWALVIYYTVRAVTYGWELMVQRLSGIGAGASHL